MILPCLLLSIILTILMLFTLMTLDTVLHNAIVNCLVININQARWLVTIKGSFLGMSYFRLFDEQLMVVILFLGFDCLTSQYLVLQLLSDLLLHGELN
jgi:hypothetical protein